MPHAIDHGSDYLHSLPEPQDPLELLLQAEEQALEDWDDSRDRPDFARVGRTEYIRQRTAYLLK